MRESQITRAVIEHWKKLGVPGSLVASIPNQLSHGQYGLTKGLPDLLVIGPNGVSFLELKTDNGKLSEAQVTFKELCEKRGIPMTVTYGRDEPIRALEAWGVVVRRAGA